MLPKTSPTNLPAWKKLKDKASQVLKEGLRKYAFEKDAVKESQISEGGVLFDFSRNLIDSEILSLLEQLVGEAEVKSSFSSLLKGEKINETEHRAVLHAALRNPEAFDFELDGKNIKAEILQSQSRMRDFSDAFTGGKIHGFTGKSSEYHS